MTYNFNHAPHNSQYLYKLNLTENEMSLNIWPIDSTTCRALYAGIGLHTNFIYFRLYRSIMICIQCELFTLFTHPM